MHRTAHSLFVLFFCLSDVTSFNQVSAAEGPRKEQLDTYSARQHESATSGIMASTVGGASDRRALQAGRGYRRRNIIRSFGIDANFTNSFDLEEGTSIVFEFEGESGSVGYFTVYANVPGVTDFYSFCFNNVYGDPSIWLVDGNMYESALGVEIESRVCECGVDGCFDPHLQGLRGQHVEWTGVDGGWYAFVKDDEDDLQINVRTTAPMPEAFPDRQFITGLSVISKGHSLVVEVEDPHTVETEGCLDEVSPCLADGGLRVSVDGEQTNLLAVPTNDVHLPGDIDLSSSNLPVECREFGGRKVWARMQKGMMLRGRRQLSATSLFEDWMLSFTNMVAPEYCAVFVANNNLFKVQSNQALLRIVTPTAVVRLSAGINHRRAGKTDRYGRDLPELDFWQMGVGVEGLTLEHESLSGLLGGTARVVVDSEGNVVMEGTEALSGIVEDYRVSGAEGADFALLHN